MSITARQVVVANATVDARLAAASGTYTGVFQSNGAASFDGLSAVTISLAANTGQAVATPLTWSGTYSVQANCAGVINIATGGSATLTVALHDQGNDFELSGSDANYSYSGSGNSQPTTACSASTFSGVYTFSGTGFELTGTAVSGAENGTGLLQFDGVSNVTANLTMVISGGATGALTLTGPYTIKPNCTGSATLTDASGSSYTMTLSTYNNTVANAAAFVGLAQSATFLVSGGLRTAYGQPAPSTAADVPAGAQPLSGAASRGGRS